MSSAIPSGQIPVPQHRAAPFPSELSLESWCLLWDPLHGLDSGHIFLHDCAEYTSQQDANVIAIDRATKLWRAFTSNWGQKKYLHQNVYSSGRKRLAVQSSAKVFWREPVTPHPRTDFWCALEKGVDCGPPSTCGSFYPASSWDTIAPCPCCAPFGLCREAVGWGDLSTSQGYLQSCHLAG